MSEERGYAEGTEVYYTGDVANQPGFGVITERTHGGPDPVGYWIVIYGQHSDTCTCGIDVEECEFCVAARKFHVFGSNFQGPGCRFMLRSEYDANIAAKLQAMRERYPHAG